MKRIRVIGLVVAVVGLLVVGLAGTALAHGPEGGEAGTSSGKYLDQPTLTRVAQTLGLTQDELLFRLQGGETISEIASDQNIPEDQIVETIIVPYRDELQLQVKYGYISQEQADALLEQARDHARDLLDGDLSSPREYGSYSWEEMVDDCNEMMGNWGGSQSGWGGMGGSMMGGGMTGGSWDSSQNGWGGMMSGWNNMMGGLGGMMGGW